MSLRPLVLSLAACTALAGCFGATPNLYLMDPPAAARSMPDRLGRVEVQKVNLPQYASAPEIATQQAGGTLKGAKNDLWADTPSDAITRILADQISQLSGATALAEPWPLNDGPDRRLQVRIGQIFAGSDGQLHLSGRYFVIPAGAVGRGRVRNFDISVPLAGTGAADVAKAQAAALHQLAVRIAALR
ncbi:PqiC family protein [Acidimangrovimonas sediminis]|uniref:PqiC family protein n=1 Tax=Acidimangrovimonas sediminis TaxID=2056283 RepID=UPI000C80FF3A|nr:PqiC family protein [Acidimangrovimonas sediminis]